MNPQMEPLFPDPTRDREREGLGVLFGVLGLVGLAALATVAGGVFVMGSDSCFDGDTALICTPAGQQVAARLPISGSVGGLAVAVVGCWVWPRRHRALCLLLGYAIALGALCAGFAVFSSNSR